MIRRRKIFVILWLLAFHLGGYSQSSDFAKRLQKGKEAYNSAVSACNRGEKSKARELMTHAKQYFNAAARYASPKEKTVVSQWINKCGSFSFDCTKKESAPVKQHTVASEKWTLQWDSYSKELVMSSSQRKTITYKMVNVTAGSLQSGTVVNRFKIGSTEVTQLLWNTVLGKPSNAEHTLLPVTNVSWDDCEAFLSRLNEITGERFRLPEEYEWEFAAVGGNASRGYVFSGSNNLSEVTSCDQALHKVGSKTPNELGLYDMTGNVWEWCNTSIGGDKIMKGGGYFEAALHITKKLKPNAKEHQPSTYRSNYCGFRLAMSE